jgi:broad specificity phosphatase PhoE
MVENLKTLSSVEWGRAALNLLSRGSELIPNSPAALIIRHSERDEPDQFKDILKAKLTLRGQQAAFEFGRNLPANKKYVIYHSPIERCQVTAEQIHEGITSRLSPSIIKGTLDSISDIKTDRKEVSKIIDRDYPNFLFYWIANFYPTDVVESSFNISKRVSKDIDKHFKSADDNTVFIYVTHDWHVTGVLFHFSAILNTIDWIEYLDGFFLQKKDDKLVIQHKFGTKIIYKPAWWK